ncbi:ABC transporter permease [Leucobacter allii]|uniref:ABC transporter permease n=1 Tax=Leucobacter allii TaxID=2932247 RepID=UPI001FD52A44|nr:ABC transporter permease [Leucobacter allii]UOR02890.1 ABC transporter permease [Leucobacter allii]
MSAHPTVPVDVAAAERFRETRWRRPGSATAWLAAPGILLGIVFVAIPVILVVVYSFMSKAPGGVGVAGPANLESWQKLLFEEDFSGTFAFNGQYLEVLWRSVWVAALTTVLAIVIAVPTAVWIATRRPRARTLLLLAVTIPFWTNTLIRTYAWMILLNDQGIVNSGIGALGLSPLPLYPSQFATVIGLVYVFVPFMILPIYTSAAKLDFRLAEAAYDLGATRWRVVTRVLLPSLRSGILAGSLLVFVPALGAFIQPMLLGGAKVDFIGTVIQRQFKESMNWPFGAAISVALLILTLLALLGFAFAAKRVSAQGEKVSLL